MKLAVIGTGYVGLVTGVCFAAKDNEVICVDNDPKKLEKLRKGVNTIYEPGLDELLEKTAKDGKIIFTDDLKEAVDKSDIIFLCLPTPPKEDGSADLQYVLQVAEEIGKDLDSFKIIVNKSTVPVGTGDLVAKTIAKKTQQEFAVASNPEFLREGCAVEDFLNPERVVIGANNKEAEKKLVELYKPFTTNIKTMNIKSSELTKYAANSFLATKISFINEIANLCDKVGANVEMVADGIGADSRIGSSFLKAGIGYGGSCFPKDVSALHKTGKQNNYNLEILDSVMKVNQKQKDIFIEKIVTHFKGELGGKKIAVWGLSFKPDTDDIREAPSLYILKKLIESDAQIIAHDPIASSNFKKYSGIDIEHLEDKYETLKDADALVLLTEWNHFKETEPQKIKELLKSPIVFDGRNVYNPEEMKNLGFTYYSVGR